MEEIEIVEGMEAAAAGAGAEGMAGIAVSEGAMVEANAAVAEMAVAPDIPAVVDAPPAVAEPGGAPVDPVADPAAEGRVAKIKAFVAENPYANKMWKFSKFVGKNAAIGGLVFGVTYGLNKALAQKAHETGKRTALSEYLKGAQTNFEKIKLKWDDDLRQRAAELALGFPWIDATA